MMTAHLSRFRDGLPSEVWISGLNVREDFIVMWNGDRARKVSLKPGPFVGDAAKGGESAAKCSSRAANAFSDPTPKAFANASPGLIQPWESDSH